MLSRPLRLTLCLHSCHGQTQAEKQILRAIIYGPMAQPLLGWAWLSVLLPCGGISLICRAGKGATPACRSAELAAVSAVTKVPSVCARCLRGVWAPHSITRFYSHTPCGTQASEVMAVTPLAMAFPATRELPTRHTALRQQEQHKWKNRTCRLWMKHPPNRPGLRKPSRALPHVKLQTILRQS